MTSVLQWLTFSHCKKQKNHQLYLIRWQFFVAVVPSPPVSHGAEGRGAQRLFLSELGQLCPLSPPLACAAFQRDQSRGRASLLLSQHVQGNWYTTFREVQIRDAPSLGEGELRDPVFLGYLPMLILALCPPQSGLSLCSITKHTCVFSICLRRSSWQVQSSYCTTWQYLTPSYSVLASRSFFSDDHKPQTSIYTINSMNMAHFNFVDNVYGR